jgi:NADP-dependent 3-hydroxy acid dehydrogenase YdfG
MAMNMNLSGRRVLVTGASSGIGAAMCKSVVRCGGSVAMLARRKDRLDALKAELGERAVGMGCDVTDLDALQAAVDEAARALGGLDAVVAVAGRAMVGTIATGAPQGWRELFDLNLVAPLATVRFALGHLPTSGRRDIVFVGSTGGITPMQGVGIYGASKRGLRAAFDALRLELAASGIGVSLVMPGMFDTEGLVGALAINGEMPMPDAPMFAEGSGPCSPEALTDSIAFMMSLPDGVCASELVMRPTGQLVP